MFHPRLDRTDEDNGASPIGDTKKRYVPLNLSPCGPTTVNCSAKRRRLPFCRKPDTESRNKLSDYYAFVTGLLVEIREKSGLSLLVFIHLSYLPRCWPERRNMGLPKFV